MRHRLTSTAAFGRWPWLALTLVVGLGALFVLHLLHEREATARAAAPKAEQLAVELFDMMEVARTVRDELPADDASAIPAILGGHRDQAAVRRLRELDAILEDPAETRELHRRLDALQAAHPRPAPGASPPASPRAPRERPRRPPRGQAGGPPVVDGLPVIPRTPEAVLADDPRGDQKRVVEALAAEAVAVARRQRDQAEATSRQTLIGAAAVLVAALLLITLLALHSQRALRDTHAAHADHLRRLADEDALTGLGNRRVLDGRLAALTPDAVDIERVQVFLCDLDGFKTFNDRLGHEAGDRLLADFASRLADAVGDDGRAYRLGGDEFCIVGEPGADLEQRVADATAGYGAEGVSGTIGMAVWPDEAEDGSAALKLADQRMYAGKRSTRAAA